MNELPMSKKARAELVNVLLDYSGTPRHRLYEYPHRDDDSDRFIANAEAVLDKMFSVLEQASQAGATGNVPVLTLHDVAEVASKRIPPVNIDYGNTLPELEEVVTNPALRNAIWNVLRAEGFTDEQISFNEQPLGRHTSGCKCGGYLDDSGKSRHRILDRYNAVKDIIKASGVPCRPGDPRREDS